MEGDAGAGPGESDFRRSERERFTALRVHMEASVAERRGSGAERQGNIPALDAAVIDLLRGQGGERGVERVQAALGAASASTGDASRRATSGTLAAAWSPASAHESVPSGPPAESTIAIELPVRSEAGPPSGPTLSSAALAELDRRLRDAAARNESAHAELLELLLRFDEARGWRTTGAKHCAAWMSAELGICAGLAWEKLRVARVLRVRPLLARLYRSGRLGWSKVRALARVVDGYNETALCAMALDATAAEVARECEALRTRRTPADVDDEIAADRRRFLERRGDWNERIDGSVAFRFVLPPDMAANVIGALQAMEDRLYRSDGTLDADPDVGPAAASTEAASERGQDGCGTVSATMRMAKPRHRPSPRR